MPVETLGVAFVVEGLGTFIGSMDRADKAIDGVGTEADKTGGILDSALGYALGNVLVKAADMAFNALVKVGGAIIGMVDDSISLESAFAGVIKTTDGLTTDTGELTVAGEEMRQAFRDLAKDVPIAVEELMAIGEVGGQLGIQRENLIEFTDTIAAMGEATNLSAEEAATGMAQFANVMGTSQSDIDNLGSAIVYLGNNFATTEKDVLNFAQRLSGAGSIAGLTEGDVLGIGAAFSSIGVNAEAGSTAVQKVILGMNTAVATSSEELDKFARAAGMSSSEFADLWEKDAATAFSAFVGGLGEAGDDATQILADLGLEDQRLLSSFLALSQNSELLEDSIRGANDAFTENTALMQEAEARYGTTESQMQLLQNNLRDFGFTIGDAVLPAINELIAGLLPLAEQYGPLLADMLASLAPILVDLVQQFFTFISALQNDAPNAFNELAPVIQFAQGIIQQFMDFYAAISPLIEEGVEQMRVFWESLKTNADTIWGGIQKIISGALDFILGFIQTWLAVTQGNWDIAWQGIVTMVQGAWDLIKGIIETVFGLILTIVGTSTEELYKIISDIWDSIQEATQAVWDAIVALIIETLESIKTNAQTALDSLKGIIETAMSTIKSSLIDPIVEAKDDMVGAIDGAIEGIKGVLTDVDLSGLGGSMIDGVVSGMNAAAGRIAAAFTSIIQAAIAAALRAIGAGSPSKLTRDLIGKSMAEGIMVGLAEMTPLVQAQLVNTVTPSNIAPVQAGYNYVSNSIDNSMSSVTNNNFTLQPQMLLETVGMTVGV